MLRGAISSLTGGTAQFDAGAQQDGSALSLGSALAGGDYVSQGAGFDVADLKIFDSLVSQEELIAMANQYIPEPTAAFLSVLGGLVLLRRRRN